MQRDDSFTFCCWRRSYRDSRNSSKNGAKVDAKANVEEFKGYTPLHCAGEGGHTKIAKILIANRANVNAKADHLEKTKGITPLHYAAVKGHTEVVKILIANGANVNAKIDAGEAKGITPLHCAAIKGHTEIVRILIANGADPLLKNKDGKTPRNLAERDFIKKLLKEAEEKQLKQQALNKSISAGGATVLLGTAAAVALFATGTAAIELIPIVIAVATVAIAALAVGGATYMMLKPSTEMDEVEEEQGITGDERKA
ncbi:ankyrin repeat domain-containing protein [Wolbachia endosymbiont (group A) of Myopa testacea]|uniref:ankyrin repeat domain-containing protein n=1 Tax=Wolbachia endosymbiont (group A) of Myopa testacea TaxID=3066148 RepID=UPI00333E5385